MRRCGNRDTIETVHEWWRCEGVWQQGSAPGGVATGTPWRQYMSGGGVRGCGNQGSAPGIPAAWFG